jgi:hypothetical protein
MAQVLFENHGIRCTQELAAGVLLESWAQLSGAVFLLVWNFNGTLNELEPDDDSSDDGKFELRLHSENDDADTWIEECNTESNDLVVPDDWFVQPFALFAFIILFSNR